MKIKDINRIKVCFQPSYITARGYLIYPLSNIDLFHKILIHFYRIYKSNIELQWVYLFDSFSIWFNIQKRSKTLCFNWFNNINIMHNQLFSVLILYDENHFELNKKSV